MTAATAPTRPPPDAATAPADNLVDEAWIPVVSHPSGAPRVSLRTALLEAH